MGIEKWKMFGAYYRACGSQTYDDVVGAVRSLASSSLVLLDNKPEEERDAILAKAQTLTMEVMDIVAGETPMVAGLALMGAIRVHEQLIWEQVKQNKQKAG